MFELIARIFDPSDFTPRWHCGNWSMIHGWVHIISDVAIFGAYTAIPCVLTFFVLRRRDIPFSILFLLFGMFILSCGVGHLVEASLFWHPWYRFSGLMKVLTAIVSWGTVFALVPLVPKVLSLPGLSAVNARLEAEISERRRIEEELRKNGERLRQTNQDLERFSQGIVGRENRVIELKHEVNSLRRELGREPHYLVELAEPGKTPGE